MTSVLRMPGSNLMSRLRVYDTPTPDGQIGGTPHVHLVCTEMYYVLSGRGAVEIIDKDGYSCVPLEPDDALLFSAGTIHRLINPNGDLEILVIMQNSGLPERGDNVVTFPEAYLSTDETYAEAMRVTTIDEAYQRRDRGVEGFTALKAAFDRSREAGQAALAEFYTYAEARTASRRPEWQTLIKNGALAAATESLGQLQQLAKHDTGYLNENQYTLITGSDNKLGFCGHLNRYFDPATLLPEGILRS